MAKQKTIMSSYMSREEQTRLFDKAEGKRAAGKYCDRCGNPLVEPHIYYIWIGTSKRLCDACHDSYVAMMSKKYSRDEGVVMAAKLQWFGVTAEET